MKAMVDTLRLLAVDDDPSIQRLFQDLVARKEPDVAVSACGSAEEALELFERAPFQIAFVDLSLPGIDGTELLRRLKARWPDTEVVVITGFSSVESVVQCMKLGAGDYLVKPFQVGQVSIAIERLRRIRRLEDDARRLRRELESKGRPADLIGMTPEMEQVLAVIDRVRREDCTVLIQGESGTGKEVAARAVWKGGPRAAKPFVTIDCASVHKNLLESELFGHERGAFTGAHARTPGLFQTGAGGTLFLDEIAEIPLDLQPALLRAIEQKQVRPVGGTTTHTVDVRILSATNRNLEDLVERGGFRRDLYYRLNVVTLTLPPLRRRKDDIPLLVDYFLKRHGGGGHIRLTGLSRAALFVLLRYDWPGNVRELEHVVQRAYALARGPLIEVEDIPPSVVSSAEVKSRPAAPALQPRTLEEVEIGMIQQALREHGGDTEKVSRLLGINRSTLYRKVRRYRIPLQELKR